MLLLPFLFSFSRPAFRANLRNKSPHMSAWATSATSASGERALRVLCLHGKGGSGPIFEAGLAPLRDALPGVEWECPTAPHAAGGGFAWWSQYPEGARSFEAERFDGFETSLALVQQCWARQPAGFDVVLGHSQGAMMAAIIAAQSCVGREGEVAPAAAIINGAAWPKPFSELLHSTATRPVPATLHVIGQRDTTNPPELGKKLAQCAALRDRAKLVTHPGGHFVPMDDPESFAAICAFIRGLAEEKKQIEKD